MLHMSESLGAHRDLLKMHIVLSRALLQSQYGGSHRTAVKGDLGDTNMHTQAPNQASVSPYLDLI